VDIGKTTFETVFYDAWV